MKREEIIKQLGGIVLKNIDLSKVSLNTQVKKVIEEENEFFEALSDLEYKVGNKDHVIEEFWDTVQSKLGLLEKHGISAEDVTIRYDKHIEKIKNRPRD